MRRIWMLLFLGSLSAHGGFRLTPRQSPLFLPSQTVGNDSSLLTLQAQRFSSQARIDEDGSVTDYPSGESFTQDDLFLRGQLGVRPRLDLLGGLSFRQNSFQNAQGDFTERGVETASAGLRYQFPPQGSWEFSLESLFHLALYSVEEYTTAASAPQEIALGDGEERLDVNLHASHAWRPRLLSTFQLGLHSPLGDQSREVFALTSLNYLRRNWVFRAGLSGVVSLKTDAFSDNPAQKPVSGQQTTLHFNGVNRSFVRPFGGLHFRLGPTGYLQTEMGYIWQGQSIDRGWEGGLSLVWWFDESPSPEQRKRQAFKEYELQAEVTKVSPRGGFVRLDRGLTSDLEKGMPVDFYAMGPQERNRLVAQGRLFEVRAGWSIARIEKLFTSKKVKEGDVARFVIR